MNYNDVIEPLESGLAYKATKYLSYKKVVKATRKRYAGKFGRGSVDIILTIGAPNYVEREFIKLCKKAGEPFPIKKVQLKLYVPKKSNLKPRSKAGRTAPTQTSI